MAIPCEDVSARMMELLYGELPAGERAPLEAHLAGCESCRTELADFQKTRALARRVVDETPPARAHEAILRAATAAVAARAGAPEKPAQPARGSLRDWLRSHWTLPTLATVGAVAVFLLASRIFLEPEKTYQRGRQGLLPTPVEAPANAPASEAQPPLPDPAGAAEAVRPKPAAEAQAAAPRAMAPEMAPQMAPQMAPEDPARIHATAKRKGYAGSGTFGAIGQSAASSARAERSFSQAPPPRKQHPVAVSDDALPELDELDGARSGGAPGSGFAASATRRPEPRATAANPVKKAKQDLGGQLSDLDGEDAGGRPGSPSAIGKGAPLRERAAGGGPAAPLPAPAPPPRASPPAAAKRERVEEAASEDQAIPAEEDEVARDKSVRKAAETPVALADRLFSEGRWNEAAAAYRELIRRDPRNGDANRWRQRLIAAEAALAPRAPAAAPAP
jgi:Putative zinc-finger